MPFSHFSYLLIGGLFSAACAPLQSPPALLSPQFSQIDPGLAQHAPTGQASVQILARGKNAFLGLLKMAPGGSVPEHRDATEEYIHILAGNGTIYINDEPHPTKPGTTVYMPAGAKVRYINGDTELVALQVFAGPEPAAKYEGWKEKN